MTPKAILFDCDGVIVDSEGPMLDLLLEDFRSFGFDIDHDDLLALNLGGAVPQFVPRLKAMGVAVPEGWVEGFYARLYAILRSGTPLISGIEQVLDAVNAAGLKMAIGSNGRHEKMQITLGQHDGIRARFGNRIYSGQALGMIKPDPALYLYIAEQLDTPPADCVVIEDSPNGARAARAAGMRCFGYAQHAGADRLKAEGAIAFHDMTELPGLLNL